MPRKNLLALAYARILRRKMNAGNGIPLLIPKKFIEKFGSRKHPLGGGIKYGIKKK